MSDETMREIVERIKERRLALNYSYQDLADKTGLSKSTLQRYEAGAIKNIPLDKVKDLAKGLGVTPEWLMGWNETKLNEDFFRVMQDAQNQGYTPDDVSMALDFLARARNRDKTSK